MIRSIATAIALSLCGIASAATAEEVTLNQPIVGASLHTGGIDMAFYYQDVDAGMEVSGYYVPRGTTEQPARLRMVLQDGERVSFSLPDTQRVVYSFERDGETLTINARSPWNQLVQR